MRHSVVSCFILVAAIAIPELVESSSCGCLVRYKAIGCKKDKRSNRALPEMLINERDVSSHYYNNINIDWYNFDQYLPAFTCRCAQAAKRKGYKYFGLQFWGECWSGPSPAADEEFGKHGDGGECYGPSFQQCSSRTEQHDNCVGDNNHNFIYELEHCPIKFERLGCYQDRHQNPRPLPSYILTDRQGGLAASSGRSIDWKNYDVYLPEFACRCAHKAVDHGWNTFGVQYYGECWSSESGDNTYDRDGEVTTCTNECWKDCSSNDRFCTGMGHTNFVYRVVRDVCEIPYKPVGCFREPESERVISELIVNDVDPLGPGFTANYPTFYDDWETYMKGLICRCARKIKEKGYKTFAIDSEGKCYSSYDAGITYANHGASEECYHEETTPCNSNVCSGGKNTNYVYQLEDSADIL